ncbi:ImmA/IrrE family metallo-endopeptidase [Dactylosporangium sp. AC04546]|uniref:ImmA/IrrE family metallo-endopeptidase n=1 Tax=Dactylosporangium sp. AC04546 TaxID=2862460 RepID=UPI001EDFAF9C|nr:ImmA/IrrE family metallo-endopeptidase [Dactylosporangium sp. AC04546]WVK82336.1 ImmA/IrrE family metallo-endopeptidase [Dactylosporangium sp. AC04546]
MPTLTQLRRFAVEIRRADLGLDEYEPFCPYRLAEEHGVDVYALDELPESGCSQQAVDHFTSIRPDVWSAALVPVGTGRFIVENATHNPQRRRSNVSHEMAHLLLEHEVDGVLFSGGQRGCLNPTTQQMETDAAELGAELLLTSAAALRAARAGKTDEQVAEQYDVSVELARWRLNCTGARKRAEYALRKRHG